MTPAAAAVLAPGATGAVGVAVICAFGVGNGVGIGIGVVGIVGDDGVGAVAGAVADVVAVGLVTSVFDVVVESVLGDVSVVVFFF